MTFLLRTVAAAAVAAAALPLFGVAPAAAHTALTSSAPSDGDAVEAMPAAVVLVFNEPVAASFIAVVVSGPDGAVVADGTPTVDGATVTQPLPPPSPPRSLPGRYQVAYRVVSADGHPVSGSTTFTVVDAGRAPEAAPGAATPATAVADRPAAADRPARSLGPRLAVLSGAAVILGAGAVAAVWWQRRRARGSGDTERGRVRGGRG